MIEFRYYVISRLRTLEILDHSQVTPQEREAALKVYKNMEMSVARLNEIALGSDFLSRDEKEKERLKQLEEKRRLRKIERRKKVCIRYDIED